MDEQEVILTAASKHAEELQAVVADQEREIQTLLSRVRNKADNIGEMLASCELSEQSVETLSWTVDSVRTELEETAEALRGIINRMTQAEGLIR